LSTVRSGALDKAAHCARSPQARETHPGQSTGLGARPQSDVFFTKRSIFRGTVAPPSSGMERAPLEVPVWMLRSFARSDCDEYAAGPCGSSLLRGGIHPLPRNVARKASAARRRMRAAGAL